MNNAVYSRELKAMMLPDNFLDNEKGVLKEACMTVQDFAYDCVRKINNHQEAYGPSESVVLRFTVRVNAEGHARQFYSQLASLSSYHFSFLFNASFNKASRLEDYEDGMVFEGYVVRVEENYTSQIDADGSDRQMLLNIQVLVKSITYLGWEKHSTIKFIQ